MLNTETTIWTIRIPKEINNHTGYTPSNLVRLLLSVNARTANILSVGVHITESHNVKNIQKMINAFEMDRNRISAHIFLFSVLFTLEKNIHKHIHEATSNPTKCKLKFWGLSIVKKLETELGMYVQVSREKET